MNILSPVIAAPVTSGPTPPQFSPSGKIFFQISERGEHIDASVVREAMERAFAASDSSGAWNWKDAYEACEVLSVLFLRGIRQSPLF